MGIRPGEPLGGLGLGTMEIRGSAGINVPPALQAVVFEQNALGRGSQIGVAMATATNPDISFETVAPADPGMAYNPDIATLGG